VGGGVGELRIAAATWSESTTPASGRHLRSDRHKIDHVTATDPERACDLKRRAIVQGSRWGKRCYDSRWFRNGLASGSKWRGGLDLLVSVLLALGCQIKRATGPGPRSDHRPGRVTPATRATGRTANLVDGPGPPTW